MADVLEMELAEEDTQSGRYLTFALDNELYGIEIKHITEIIGLQPVTKVPEFPDYMRGIINLRGKIIPVMDIRLRFHKPFREYDDRTCVIIIELMNLTMGLIVDSVEEVIAIPDTDIVDPVNVSMVINKFIKGIGKVDNEVKLLLDCGMLLNVDQNNEMKGQEVRL